MRNLIYISLALALSVNAIAKPLYKDVLVGTTKISDLVETFEKNKCVWYKEKDKNNRLIYRVEDGCFKEQGRDEIISLVPTKNGVIKQKGIIYLESNPKKEESETNNLIGKYGKPVIVGNIKQWDAGNKLVSLFKIKDSFAIYESIIECEAKADSPIFDEIPKKIAKVEEEMHFDQDNSFSREDAYIIQILLDLNLRKKFPKYKLILGKSNKKTHSTTFVEKWDSGHGLPKRSLDRFLNDDPDVLGELLLERLGKKEITHIVPRSVCYEESTRLVFRVTCMFNKKTLSVGVFNKNINTPITEMEKLFVRRLMRSYDEFGILPKD